MDIAPFRGLRYNLERLAAEGLQKPAAAVTAPPYDVLSPSEHAERLAASPYNITALTLGTTPGETSDYDARAAALDDWVEAGVLIEDPQPRIYAYTIDYALPTGEERRRFCGLLALGRIRPFADGIVLPHEQTFPKVVDDRVRLLDATRTHLESIALLYADRDGEIDQLLLTAADAPAAISVEAKPGEHHSLHPISDAATIGELQRLFTAQRPIIADGHHRYTMGVRYRDDRADTVPGCDWQLMTFANLYSDGLTILATHRLVKLHNLAATDALTLLRERLDEVGEGGAWDLCVETSESVTRFRFPESVRSTKRGVAGTSYSLLHTVVFDDWLRGHVPESGVSYYKESTGERVALERGDGDLLFRLQPVDRDEFQTVVQGHEVFPHKTTYFYPKLWSGLALWRLAAVDT